MRKIFLLFILFSVPSLSQTFLGNRLDHGISLPSTCNIGHVFFLTQIQGGNAVGLYQCLVTNTWSVVGGAAGTTGPSGTPTVNDVVTVAGTNQANRLPSR